MRKELSLSIGQNKTRGMPARTRNILVGVDANRFILRAQRDLPTLKVIALTIWLPGAISKFSLCLAPDDALKCVYMQARRSNTCVIVIT